MTLEFLYMLKILRCIVVKSPIEPPDENMSWEKFTETAGKHNLTSVLYSFIVQLPTDRQPPKEILDSWKTFTMNQSMFQLRKNIMLTNFLKEATKREFCIVLMKGPLMGNLYPEPHSRITSDADVLIHQDDQVAVGEMLFELGYVLEEGLQNSNEITYVNSFFRIEVHTALWEETEGPRYEALSSLQMDDFDNIVATEVNGANVYRQSTDNSLIYLFYHMIKHFFVSGIGARYLLDMTLFIRHYSDEIDWTAFWEKCNVTNYTKFCRAFLYLCVNYLGLEQEILKGVTFDDSDRLSAEKILNDICIGGHNGKATAERNGVSRFIQLYYNEKLEKLSTWAIIRQVFGRMSDEMDNEQHEAGENSADNTKAKQGFAPFVWIKKIFNYIPKYIKSTKEKGSLFTRIRGIKKRSGFLDDLDLMN